MHIFKYPTRQRSFLEKRLIYKNPDNEERANTRKSFNRTEIQNATRGDLSELQNQIEKNRPNIDQKKEENEKNLGNYWKEVTKKIDQDEIAADLKNAREAKTHDLQGGWDRAKMSRMFLERDEAQKTGLTFTVNLKNDQRFENNIGAGHILPHNATKIMVKDLEGKTRIGIRRETRPPNNTRIGYFDDQGYISIYSGYTITILETIPENSKDAIEQKTKEDLAHTQNGLTGAIWHEDQTVPDIIKPLSEPQKVMATDPYREIDGKRYSTVNRNYWYREVGENETQARGWIVTKDPVEIGKEVTFMRQKIKAGANKMILPYLKEAEAQLTEAGVDYNFDDVQGFNWRNIAGSNSRSLHSWGVALDINPGSNRDAKNGGKTTDMPPKFIEIMEKLGFTWGGRWTGKTYDPMHFEFSLDPKTSTGLLQHAKSREYAEKIFGGPMRTGPEPRPASEAISAPAKEKIEVKGDKNYNAALRSVIAENPGFLEKVDEIAAKIGCHRRDILWIMWKESGFNHQAVNYQKDKGDSSDPYERAKTRATGLIQFMPATSASLRTTNQQLFKMSALDQLHYVEKYFQPSFGKIHNYADLYLTVFYPAALDKGMDFVFGSEPKAQASPEKIAEQNKGINHGQPITKAAFYNYAGQPPEDLASDELFP